MKIKALKGLANQACEMFIGWRADWEKLASMPRGFLVIDLVAASTELDGKPVAPWGIALELQAWFREQLAVHEIPETMISTSLLSVRFENQPNRKHPRIVGTSDLELDCEIAAGSTSFRAHREERVKFMP